MPWRVYVTFEGQGIDEVPVYHTEREIIEIGEKVFDECQDIEHSMDHIKFSTRQHFMLKEMGEELSKATKQKVTCSVEHEAGFTDPWEYEFENGKTTLFKRS